MIIYSDKLLPRCLNIFFYCIPGLPMSLIVVRPKLRDDRPLLEHELTHKAQFDKQRWTYVFKMLFNRKFRMESEAEAYAVEASYDPDPIARVKNGALLLSQITMLKITPSDAERVIMRHFSKLPVRT